MFKYSQTGKQTIYKMILSKPYICIFVTISRNEAAKRQGIKPVKISLRLYMSTSAKMSLPLRVKTVNKNKNGNQWVALDR
jgi:hypothetical protein